MNIINITNKEIILAELPYLNKLREIFRVEKGLHCNVNLASSRSLIDAQQPLYIGSIKMYHKRAGILEVDYKEFDPDSSVSYEEMLKEVLLKALEIVT